MSVLVLMQFLRFLAVPNSWAAKEAWKPEELKAIRHYTSQQYLSEVRHARMKKNGSEFLTFIADNEQEREQETLKVMSQKLKGPGLAKYLDQQDWIMWLERKHD